MTKENWPSDLFVLAAEIISNSPWSNLLQSQQALSTYRGLVPFNFQRLENNFKPFELLIEPSSDETSLSMIMIIKCDQNKSLNVEMLQKKSSPSAIFDLIRICSEKGLERVYTRCTRRSSRGLHSALARLSRGNDFLDETKRSKEWWSEHLLTTICLIDENWQGWLHIIT